MGKNREILRQSLDALKKTRDFGVWRGGRDPVTGVQQWPWFRASPAATLALGTALKIIYESEPRIALIDWVGWKEGTRLLENKNFQGLDLIHIASLIHGLSRNDRCCPGVIGGAWEDGTLESLLHRLWELSEGLVDLG